MKNGTSDKSSVKKGRIQLPEFEPPVVGVKGSIPHQSPSVVDIESAAQALLAQTQDSQEEQILKEGDAEFMTSQEIAPGIVEIIPPTPEQMTVSNLYKMIQDLQKQGGRTNNIEMKWADAISEGHTNVELEDADFHILTQRYKEKPSSVIYKDVRFFKKGTMLQIIEDESLNVDFVRGLSKHKHSQNRFKGR